MRTEPAEPAKGPLPATRMVTASGHYRPVLIAHRCGAGLGPENTCGAVVQSSFYRPDFYEIDIRHTSDGVAICLHDETLDRTTNLEGQLSAMSSEEIVTADAGSWFDSTFTGERIPRLETMLDCVNPSPLAIELKEPEISTTQCNQIAALLNGRGDISSVILSFHQTALDTYRQADESRRTCYLTLEMDDYALEGPHEIVGLLYSSVTEQATNEVHAAGKAIWVWTVNEDFGNFIDMGVDGIVTNYTNRLREAIPPS